MLRFLLVSVFIFSYCFATAQTRWDNKNYKKISQSNFRYNPIFSQNIDKSIDYGLLNATLFYLSNEYRVKNRKNPLNYHASLEIAAWNHAK